MRKQSLQAAFLSLISLLILPGATTPATPSDNTDYHLGVGDDLRIRVFEWRSATGDVHQWDALKGEYDVGADGSIAMPLLGSVKAAGLTTMQLADAISEQLQSRLKLSIRPEASIDIVQYRPFYISGDVNKPGQYPYQPGLTVLQAVSIAGGRYRASDPALVLTATGDLRVNRLDYTELLARQAELRAEIDGAGAMALPPELQRLQNDPASAQLIQREQALFAAHRDALNSETDALNQLKTMLNGEVGSLQGKMKNMDQELGLMNQELTNTTTLAQKGLATVPRLYELRQTQLETEGRRLDLDTAMLRAKEDVAKADQALVELRGKTRNQAETDLAEVEQKLRETGARMANETAIAGREVASTANTGEAGPDGALLPICLILRKNGGALRRVQGDENAAVEPGDTIQVLRPTATPAMASLDSGTTRPAASPASAARMVAPPESAAPRVAPAESTALRIAPLESKPHAADPPRKPARLISQSSGRDHGRPPRRKERLSSDLVDAPRR